MVGTLGERGWFETVQKEWVRLVTMLELESTGADLSDNKDWKHEGEKTDYRRMQAIRRRSVRGRWDRGLEGIFVCPFVWYDAKITAHFLICRIVFLIYFILFHSVAGSVLAFPIISVSCLSVFLD